MLVWITFGCWFVNVISGLSDLTPEFPNPQTEWRMCGRHKSSYICDPDFILERGQAERLDQLALQLKTSTSCLCSSCPENTGIPIGIFLRKNISEQSTLDQDGNNIANKIRETWGLGTCEDDIVLILLTGSNTSGFSLGASVQRVLPEGMAWRILEDCQIHFDSGYYYQGLESIVNSFNDVISLEQRKSSESYNNLLIGLLMGFAILLLIVAGITIAHLRKKRRRKMSCSNIYEDEPNKFNKKELSKGQEDQLEKLNQETDCEIEDV